MAQTAHARYPLAPLQQGMLFHWLSDPGSGVDLEQIVCTLESVDPAVFQQAWLAVARRRSPLRTCFRWSDVEEPVQEVADDVPLQVHAEDLRSLDGEGRQRRLAEWLAWDRRAGFRLDQLPLFRLAFFRTAENEHAFVWTFHHILLDGRSFELVMRDVLEAYTALEQGRPTALAERRDYREFIEWLAGQDPDASAAHWKTALAGFSEPTFPDVGIPEDPSRVPDVAEQEIRLSGADTVALGAFARRHDVTVNTLLQGAWALLLARYAGTDDVVFGATRACRRTPLDGDRAVDQMVGLFINTLPVRVRIPYEQPVTEWLRDIRRDQVAVRDVEHTPLRVAQAGSRVPSGVPLFETLVVFENEQQTTALDRIDPRCREFRLLEKTSFPLTLHAYGETELLLRIEYQRRRFDDAAVTRMLDHVATLLRAIVERGDGTTRALTQVPLVNEAEWRDAMRAWNDTGAGYPDTATIHGLIEAQARRRPDAIAAELTEGGVRHTLTYRELDRRANRLAWTLRAAGVERDDRVALCLERSLDIVVAIVGVLKAGGAYLPIDPAYPDDRIEYTVRDAGARVAITDAVRRPRFESLALGVPLLDVERAVLDGSSDDAPPVHVSPRDMAYVIYTSGSTGRPKGCMIEHRNVTRLLVNDRLQFHFDEHDAWTVFHSFAFDFSVWELFGALIYGGRAVIVPRTVAQSPADFLTLLETSGATVLNQVPSAFQGLMEEAVVTQPTLALRYVIFGGEALKPASLRRWHARWPAVKLINMFGITETTVHVTFKEIGAAEIAAGVSNVGQPIPTTTVYVLDATLQPLPIGLVGEICVGGLGVARGYLNRPELSAERFVPNPFADDGAPDALLYRSGDLGRRLPNGEIEYIGRRDHQVKVRGHRIELGEIEAALLQHPAVRECAVIGRDDRTGGQRLVAYVVSDLDDAKTFAQTLRDFLGERIPSYMVPSAFVALPELPLTANGKMDRRALPEPEMSRSADDVVAPRNDVEARVLRIWEEVLGTPNVGVTDSFNDVGGHSLAAVRVFARIQKEFGRQLQLVTMLKHDTVERIAALLGESQREEWHCIVPLGTGGNGTPVFCPHANEGNVLIYQYFANEVAGKHPVYGIQALGNWGTQEPMESVEEMVRYYADEIQKLHPNGPYIFIGVSLGGWLAIELARIMAERGQAVQMVVLYDTRGIGYPNYTLWGKIAHFARNHGGIPFVQLRRIVRPRAGEPRLTLWRLRCNVIDTIKLWYANTRRTWLRARFERRNPPHGYPLPADVPRFLLASRRIFARYHYRFYEGKLTLFRAAVQPKHTRPDPTCGWAGRSAELEIFTLPGGHTAALQRKGAASFAKQFLECVAASADERQAVTAPEESRHTFASLAPSGSTGAA